MESDARMARLVYFNEVLDGHRLEDVRYRIGTLYKLDEARLSRLFSGQRVVFMRGVDMARAQRHVQRFAKMGARLRVEAMPDSGDAARPATAAPAFAPNESMALDTTSPTTNFSEWEPTATSVSPEALATQPAGQPWPPEPPPRNGFGVAPRSAADADDLPAPSPMAGRSTLEAAYGQATGDVEGASGGHSSGSSEGRSSSRSGHRAHRSSSGRSRHGSGHSRSRSRRSSSRSIRRVQRAVGIGLLVMVVIGIWFSMNTDRVEAWAEAGMRWAGVAPRLPDAPRAPSEGSATRQAPMPTLASLPSDAARAAFQNEFAPAPAHKAFAVSPSGAWAWRAGQGDNGMAMQQAIAECNVKRTPYTPPCEVINLDGQWIPLQW